MVAMTPREPHNKPIFCAGINVVNGAYCESPAPGGAEQSGPLIPQRILVSNTKGGCGKTTLATNLAAWFAGCGYCTALVDYDPQGSSRRWLDRRPEERPLIHCVEAFRRTNGPVTRTFQMRLPTGVERVVVDAPAGVRLSDLMEMLRDTQTVLVPVLPSPIDMEAAAEFVALVGKAARSLSVNPRIGLVANRVKSATRASRTLERFIEGLALPLLTTLRDAQSYVRAAEQGLGVHELAEKRGARDPQQWATLLQWIEAPAL